MGAGRLVKWTKKPGDRIKKGDVIAEVETDKAVMEVEAFQDGYLSGPLAAEGSEAPVGDTIGYIADNLDEFRRAESAAAAPQPRGNGNAAATVASEQAPISPVLAASMATQRSKAGLAARSPALRARQTSAAAPPRSALDAGPPHRVERASSLREAVARNMIASASTPTFRVTAQLTLKPLLKAAKDRHASLSLLLARACALAIKAHPLFNAAYTPEGLARRDRVDIAIAVDDGEGLITPVLRDAAGRSLADLAADWISCARRSKAGAWCRPITAARHSI